MNQDKLFTHLRSSGQYTLPTDRRAQIKRRVFVEFQHLALSSIGNTEIKHQPWRHILTQPLAASLTVVFIIATVFGASFIANAARPGDLLYGLDRSAENVRLALTLSAPSKAEYEAGLADERLHEQAELQATNSPHVTEADQAVHQALTQALTSISHVQRDDQRRGKNNSGLTRVASRLRALQHQRDTYVQAKATIRGQQTKVEVDYQDEHREFTTSAVSFEDIVAAIVDVTGLDESTVRASLEVTTSRTSTIRSDLTPQSGTNLEQEGDRDTGDETETEKSRQHSNTDQSRRPSKDTERPGANNAGGQSASDASVSPESSNEAEEEHGIITSIRVLVDLDEQKTEIQTSINGHQDAWTLTTTAQAEILTSITTQTGLSPAQVLATWDFRQH